MRIVDTTPPKIVVKEKVCYNCDVTLEYIPADVKEKIEHDYDRGYSVKSFVKYIQCENCGKHLIV